MKNLVIIGLLAATIIAAPAAHATGSVCYAAGRVALTAAKGRDLGVTESELREGYAKHQARLAAVTGDAPAKPDAMADEVLALVYRDPRTKDFTPDEFQTAARRLCEKRFGPNF
ncbi:hypothetical protein P0D88_31530 [Paraburkholderia sp. RL18-103-BIB-C]|uniref:hypothetical protein n=1 Tax=Paraburkholderia sp. RL18-103-BIB-C TaxID=3031637 RepID=UPI0038B88ACD